MYIAYIHSVQLKYYFFCHQHLRQNITPAEKKYTRSGIALKQSRNTTKWQQWQLEGITH